MRITVQLSGVLRIGRFKEAHCVYSAGTTVAQVVADLAFAEHLLGIVLINGRHAELGAVLREGDVLSLLPLLDGG